MSPFHAWRTGVRRVASAPALLAGLWAATIAVSLPLTVAIRGAIVRQLGTSLEAETAARAMDYDWMQHFAGHATGAASTFRPTIVGFAATLDNMSALADGLMRPASIMATVAAYAVLWLFLCGGVINRYTRRPETRRRAFLPTCAEYFPRLVRLGLIMAVVYALLLGVLQPWLLGHAYSGAAGAAAAQQTAFAVRATLYAIIGLFVVAANVVFDYARVRTVVENRRSMIVAVAASITFIVNYPWAALGVYAIDAVMFALTLTAYALLAPSSGGTGAMVWAAVAIGQAYIVARLAVRLLFFATETAAFEDRLGVRRH